MGGWRAIALLASLWLLLCDVTPLAANEVTVYAFRRVIFPEDCKALDFLDIILCVSILPYKCNKFILDLRSVLF